MKNESVKRFLQKLGLIGAGAAVFGLVAGGTFAGVTTLTGAANKQGSEMTAEAPAPADTEEEKKEEKGTRLLTAESGEAAIENASDHSVAGIAASVMPSIVAITSVSEAEYRNFFGQSTGQTYESKAAGSGIIVAEDEDYLYITTNNHVVTGANALTVEFSDDSTAPAEIKGTDSGNDLAVVMVAKKDLDEGTYENIKIATMGDSDALQVGETAIAIGNALGYGQSVTTGIISATNRTVDGMDATTGEAVLATLIQTDAAINPGNSGGALINSNGEVIGINSSKYSDTTVEGMGFAIPINTAKTIVEAIINDTLEELQQNAGYLGVSGMDISEEDAEKYNMPIGVYIAKIAGGSPAEAAGLRTGQIITKVDGKSISSARELANVIQSYQSGDVVTVTVNTADNGAYIESDVSVTLGSQADRKDTEEEGKTQEGRNQGDSEERQQPQQPEMPEEPSENPGSEMPEGGYEQYFGDFDDFFEQFMR